MPVAYGQPPRSTLCLAAFLYRQPKARPGADQDTDTHPVLPASAFTASIGGQHYGLAVGRVVRGRVVRGRVASGPLGFARPGNGSVTGDPDASAMAAAPVVLADGTKVRVGSPFAAPFVAPVGNRVPVRSAPGWTERTARCDTGPARPSPPRRVSLTRSGQTRRRGCHRWPGRAVAGRCQLAADALNLPFVPDVGVRSYGALRPGAGQGEHCGDHLGGSPGVPRGRQGTSCSRGRRCALHRQLHRAHPAVRRVGELVPARFPGAGRVIGLNGGGLAPWPAVRSSPALGQRRTVRRLAVRCPRCRRPIAERH